MSAHPTIEEDASHRISFSDVQVRAFVGLLFVAAFLSLHIALFPLMEAEYQPFLFVALALFLAALVPRDVAIAGPLCVMAGLVVAALWHVSRGTLESGALVRCLIGPLFACVGPLFVRHVRVPALAVVIYVHILVAIGGIALTDLTVEFLQQLGLRGAQAGWNTFLASEPSYAALNLVNIVALFSLRGRGVVSGHLGLMAALVLLATTSITGTFFGSLVGVTWLLMQRAGATGITKVVALVTVLAGLAVLPLGMGERLQLIVDRLGVIFDGLIALDAVALFSGETSGAWRFLSNSLAALGLIDAPMGTGGVGLDAVIQRSVDGVTSSLTGIILASEVYLGLQTDFVAATPFFNYMTFGGIPAALPLLAVVAAAMLKVARSRLDFPSKLLFITTVLCGLLWQGALTSPSWWLLVGAGAHWGITSGLGRDIRYRDGAPDPGDPGKPAQEASC